MNIDEEYNKFFSEKNKTQFEEVNREIIEDCTK